MMEKNLVPAAESENPVCGAVLQEPAGERIPLIRTVGLTKEYGTKRAVSDLNLEIYSGEIFGLLGPNGAGKTTTTLMLLGLTEPSAGEAWIDGIDCTRDPIHVKKITGYMPDNVGFYGDMTGRENLRFTGRLNGLPGDLIERRCEELLERVGMTYAADQKTSTYSRGMRQRLGVADVLMKDPKVIIMDEPTLGIDPEGMRELMQLIQNLAKKDGRTILISSHQLYQIQQICDRVGLFVEGKLMACGRIDELAGQMQQEGYQVLEVAGLPDNDGLRTLLEHLGNVDAVEREGEYYLVRSRFDLRRELMRRFLSEGYTLTHLRQRGSDLDEIYRRYFERGGEEDGTDSHKGMRRS
ncbi:MAG: ABC transporter ATP-binding protein [Clostridiales bacterium]|nr:ABC transporter ATP-binding protein [Clostridiales bacterium]